jgi:hypothetical protein
LKDSRQIQAGGVQPVGERMALLWRRLSLALAIVAGLALSQSPDYFREYRHRLGGALDQAAAEYAAFEADCNKSGLTRDQGIGRLLGDHDPLVREKGFRMRQAPSRLIGLREQAEDFASSQPVVQMSGFVLHFDSEVARGAFDDLKIAMPPSNTGLIAGGLGFVVSLALLRLIASPFRERAETVEKPPARSGRRPFDRRVAGAFVKARRG